MESRDEFSSTIELPFHSVFITFLDRKPHGIIHSIIVFTIGCIFDFIRMNIPTIGLLIDDGYKTNTNVIMLGKIEVFLRDLKVRKR